MEVEFKTLDIEFRRMEVEFNTLDMQFREMNLEFIIAAPLISGTEYNSALSCFANVPAFNGVLSDSSYVNIGVLSQIYNTLLASRIRDVSVGFVMPEIYAANLRSNRHADVVAVSGLFFKYNVFADDALSTHKIDFSGGKFYDNIEEPWENPYLEKNVFAMTPAIKRLGKIFK